MPEIRLGSAESFKNINLGPIELQEIFLGSTLVWRNNVPPFFTVDVDGVEVTTNGTPMMPQDPEDATSTPLQSFLYSDVITLGFSMLADEDQPTDPIVLNLYEGDFDVDDTLPVIGTITLNPGDTGSLTIPRGPQPTGTNAADFVYADRLFSVTAQDIEEGLSIQYIRIERTDDPDTYVLGAWTNSGATYSPGTRSASSTRTETFNTECFDIDMTVEMFTDTTVTPTAQQDQVRTCSVQINGVEDVPPIVCTSAQTDQTITVDTGAGTTTSVLDSSVTSSNPNYITGATSTNTVGGASCVPFADDTTVGTCTVTLTAPTAACSCRNATCNGEETVTTQPRCADENCAGNLFNIRNNGAATMSDRNCGGATNPFFQSASGSCVVTTTLGAGVTNIGFTATHNNRNQLNARVDATCMDGSTDGAQQATTCVGSPISDIDCTGGPCTSTDAFSLCTGAAGGVVGASCSIV